MNLPALLAELEKRGIRLAIHQGELRLQAPKGMLTPELQQQLSEHKAELLALLSKESQPHAQSATMDFSLFFFASDETVQPQEKYKLLLEAVRFADSHDFVGVWTPERHFHALGGLFPNPSVISAALAMVTQRLKLRAGSVVLPLHDPLRVAEEWAVVDNLSQGRVELSFATGWHVNDFVFAPELYANRKAILFERIEMIRKLWRGETISRQSGAEHPLAVHIHPTPLQPELPVWLTAIGNPESFRQAGAIGAHLLTCLLDQEVEELGDKLKIYRQSLHDHGFDPASRKVAVFSHTYLGADYDVVKAQVREPFTRYLSSTLDLLGKLSQSAGLELNPTDLDASDQATLLNFAFERYFESRTLMGTVVSCQPMVEKLQAIGVNELACLVDFGLPFTEVMSGLTFLNQLRKKFNQTRAQH